MSSGRLSNYFFKLCVDQHVAYSRNCMTFSVWYLPEVNSLVSGSSSPLPCLRKLCTLIPLDLLFVMLIHNCTSVLTVAVLLSEIYIQLQIQLHLKAR